MHIRIAPIKAEGVRYLASGPYKTWMFQKSPHGRVHGES